MELTLLPIVVIVVVIYLLSSIKILAEYERGIIFRLGARAGESQGTRRDPGVQADRPDGTAFAARRSNGGSFTGRGHGATNVTVKSERGDLLPHC